MTTERTPTTFRETLVRRLAERDDEAQAQQLAEQLVGPGVQVRDPATFAEFLADKATEFDRFQSSVASNIGREAIIGRAAGLIGRGALGAGRFIGETASIAGQNPFVQAFQPGSEVSQSLNQSIAEQQAARRANPVASTLLDLNQRVLESGADVAIGGGVVRGGSQLARAIGVASPATGAGRIPQALDQAASTATSPAVRRAVDRVSPIGRAAARGVEEGGEQVARSADELVEAEVAARRGLRGSESQAVEGAATQGDEAALTLERQVEAARQRVQVDKRIAGISDISDDLERQVAFARAERDLRTIEPTQAAVTKLASQLREARPLRPDEIEAIRAPVRAERAGRLAGQLERGEGEQAFRAGAAELQGQLPNPSFTTPTLEGNEAHLLFEQIRTSNLRPFEKLNTNEGLRKILAGETPQQGELALLERVFGRGLVQAFMRSPATLRGRQGRVLLDVLGIPKTIRSAYDLSAPLRQGFLLGVRNPREFSAAFRDMFRSFSRRKAFEINREIFADPDVRLLSERPAGTRLFLHDVEGTAPVAFTRREEAFISRYASRIPGVGLSERTYGTFLNKLRSDVAKKTLNNWRRQGMDVTDPERIDSLNQFINIFTGRGELGNFENVAEVMNIAFWSPRLLVSRFQAPLLLRNPIVRRQVAENLAATFGVGSTVLGIIAASRLADVETDPRSTDFGKIRIGRTRLDFWAGFQQIARYMAQIITNQSKSSRTGDVIDLGGQFDTHRIDTIQRFARSKLSPGAPSIIANELFGKSFLGEDLTDIPDRGRPPENIETLLNEIGINDVREIEAVMQVAPLFPIDLVDAMEEHGLVNGTGLAIPALFGVGVQTFNEPREQADRVLEPAGRN